MSSSSQDMLSATRGWFRRRAIFFKIFMVIFFALVLLVPLTMVRSTLDERQERHAEAVYSITEPWGSSQLVIGPVLMVPFTYKVETEEWVATGMTRVKEKRIREITREVYFLPDQLNIDGELVPLKLTRGIYTAHVYSAALKITGKFDKPSFDFPEFANRADAQPLWDRARVSFMISDLRGVREALTLQWGGAAVALQPGSQIENSSSGLHALVPIRETQDGAEFSLTLTLNASDSFMTAPLARGTKMHLTSKWPDPSFVGSYLPVHRDVSSKGFEARWEASFYGRSIPQSWVQKSADGTPGDEVRVSDERSGSVREWSDTTFGVRLRPAISAYRIVERAIKYGILFIALVFTVFFLFEAVAGARLNSLNYLLAGATLCVFFLGLLALAEFIPFAAAYAISAAIATLMIGLYCKRILQSGKRALLVGAMLGGVYAYLYFVLQMEDFALLAGTSALFVVLGAIMYATRNLRTEEKAELTSVPPTIPPPVPPVQS